ncbi:hypothetical protein ScPMuIL_010621 [Solemya velum]
MATDRHDVTSEAKNFCESLANVFMLRKRDPQTRNILQKAKTLLETLISENQKLASANTTHPGTPRSGRGGGGMGQLWVKLDELKRENETLRKQIGKPHQEERTTTPKPQGPGEVIISELHKKKAENENLKSQNEKLQASLRHLESINAAVQDEYKRCKVALDISRKSMEGVVKDCKTLESSLSKAKTENDTLKQRFTRSVKPMMRPDNRQFENINERCRPSVIGMAYNDLESQEWVDAKDSLEDDVDENEINRFLCAVIMESYKASRQVHEAFEYRISEMLKMPTLSVPTASGMVLGSAKPLPDELKDSMKQLLRQGGDEIDTHAIVNIVSDSLKKNFEELFKDSDIMSKSVNSYMHACAKITWQMIIQQPQMHLSTDDSHFDSTKHRLWWSCDQSCDKIQHFIWPVLYDYENGNVLIKGCVYAV